MVRTVCDFEDEALAFLTQEERENACVVSRATEIKSACMHRVSYVYGSTYRCAVCSKDLDSAFLKPTT